MHYLELIRRKVGAFESARAIRQWRPQWPAHYETVLERLRQRHGYSRGTREFIGILQGTAAKFMSRLFRFGSRAVLSVTT